MNPNHNKEEDNDDINITLAILKERMKVSAQEISQLRLSVDRIEHKIDDKFVTNEQFKPVRLIVYGFVGMIITAVIGALITLVVKGK